VHGRLELRVTRHNYIMYSEGQGAAGDSEVAFNFPHFEGGGKEEGGLNCGLLMTGFRHL